VAAAKARPLAARQAAELQYLYGQIALDQLRGGDTAAPLLSAARQFEPLDAARARITYLETFWAVIRTGRADRLREAAEAALAAPLAPGPQRPVDVLFDALALRFTQGYAAAAPALAEARELVVSAQADLGEAGSPRAFRHGRNRPQADPGRRSAG
jgi:hypothetical protein